ncbi:hypothetical protein CKCBHOJB_00056 [Thauera sp. GDN1]|uniref:sulfatase-like hydrolase/transferase n=1 Tax=Thauera sp. GDN1 TaxID=2944810 RepID=UPI00247AF1E0|nr:sulfatase-like hydrolase/transferase [Thauera sp. GDN1]WEN40530.1 hypothetical protein CKCBHOJB_00056 [Thauera sp. GDN1]
MMTVHPIPIAILALVLPNLVFFAAAAWLDIGRAWVNADYAFVLVMLTFGRAWIGALAALVFLLMDVLTLVGQVLPFVRLEDIIYLLRFATSASGLHFALLLALALLVLAKLGLLVGLGQRLSRMASLLIFNGAILVYAIHANSGAPSGHERFYRTAGGALVGSQTVSFLEGRADAFLDLFHAEGEPLLPTTAGATAAWFDAVEQGMGKERLLLIINESWGEPVDEAIQHALLQPLRSVAGEGMRSGSLSYTGFTLGGELRELCRLRPEHYNLAKVESGFEACLPQRLQALGYSTAALHGATSVMYDRRHWYPRAGFQRMSFFEDEIRPRRCHSFPGSCDLDLRPNVEAFFAEPGKRFFYWLTLNSHPPYDPRDIHVDAFDCKAFAIPDGTESCRNLKLQAQFFTGLAHLLKSKTMAGVEVIVVGDHSPIIMPMDEKKRMFVDSRVPWVSFRTDEFSPFQKE